MFRCEFLSNLIEHTVGFLTHCILGLILYPGHGSLGSILIAVTVLLVKEFHPMQGSVFVRRLRRPSSFGCALGGVPAGVQFRRGGGGEGAVRTHWVLRGRLDGHGSRCARSRPVRGKLVGIDAAGIRLRGGSLYESGRNCKRPT